MADDEPIPRASLWRAFRTVFGLSLRASPVQAILLLVFEPLATLIGLLDMVLIGVVADAILRGDRSTAMRAVVVLGVLFAVALSAQLVGLHMRRTVSEKVTHQVDREISWLTASVTGIEHLERPDYHDRIELLRRDPQGIGNVINSMVFLVLNVLLAIASVGLLIVLHPFLLVIPAAGFVSMFVSTRTERRWRSFEESYASVSRRARHLFEMASNPAVGKEIRVFDLAGSVLARYRRSRRDFEAASRRTSAKSHAISTLGNMLQNLVWLGSVAFMIGRSSEGSATPGEVVIVLIVGSSLSGTLVSLVGNLRSFARNLRTAERFLWLQDHAALSATSDPSDRDAPPRLTSGIHVQDVSFTYPGTSTVVLEGLDVTLPAGKVVAIVGENGAGKTTLIKLLARFYDPTRGTICIDDVPLRSIPPTQWREAIAPAFQDHLHLEFLLGEAIGAGEVARMQDEVAVTTAAARGGATAVIERAPAGLATQLGRRWDGIELSGGQWQRVSLSRGLMRDAPLLAVFDEPASALDPQTEAALFDRMIAASRSEVGAGMVTLLVSHRFSTVRNADLILVLDAGRIVERGTHDELMRQDGPYAELFTIQADAYA